MSAAIDTGLPHMEDASDHAAEVLRLWAAGEQHYPDPRAEVNLARAFQFLSEVRQFTLQHVDPGHCALCDALAALYADPDQQAEGE